MQIDMASRLSAAGTPEHPYLGVPEHRSYGDVFVTSRPATSVVLAYMQISSGHCRASAAGAHARMAMLGPEAEASCVALLRAGAGPT